jgi:L,D-peptidoglycan transpeptidase YkuD (ErfK/YbiS/YcfS/YnhG family)
MSIDLIVEAYTANIHGVMRCGNLVLPCSLGRSGIRSDKHEGDGATPIGRFALRRLLYRADRLARPMTKLPITIITRDDGWCDEPKDPAYNQQIKLPYAASHEELWRDDHLYDLIVILGHNDAPVVPGMGSAIFLHVRSPEGTATSGCVAVSPDHLLSVLALVDTGSWIDIKSA